MTPKSCTKCKVEKPLEEFNKQKNGKFGRMSQCKACMAEYREANREKISEYDRRYYEENLEKISERHRRYREANREKLVEKQRKYREENREKISAYRRRYYGENREKFREYSRRYRDKYLKNSQQSATSPSTTVSVQESN